jgi:hypothetical protein
VVEVRQLEVANRFFEAEPEVARHCPKVEWPVVQKK